MSHQVVPIEKQQQRGLPDGTKRLPGEKPAYGPIAGLIAYFIVGTLENARGPIEFEALGFKFKGAGGPVTMWVVVFLALVISVHLVWDLRL